MHNTFEPMKSINTVEREIARLFKEGKNSGAKYLCSNTGQTLMNLHLVSKHGITNPFYEDIITDYKRYGRISARYTPWISAPIHGIWDLYVYFDKKGNLVRTNADDIVDIFRDNIVEMAEINRGKKFAVEFSSTIFVDDNATSGHSEMIIYDPAINTVEYMDSNNLPKHCSRKDKEYFTWSETRLETVKRIVSGLPTNPIFITNANIYDGYAWGIQTMEAASDLLTDIEREGYCLMWSHLFADLALQFPEYSLKEIVDIIMKKANSKTVNLKFTNDYMVYLIRGYVSDISQVYGVDFASSVSLQEGCGRIALKI